MTPKIEARSLRRTFGPIVAVDDISFEVLSGEVLGFLGPNGAGKSTTMRMLTGYLAPDRGEVSICGIDLARHPVRAKGSIGYLPEGAPLYPEMTPSSILDFAARARGLDAARRASRLGEVAEIVHLKEVWKQPIETLSKGYKRRVGLALSIIHDPPVLVLDEPTDGLDPNQKMEVRQLVRDMAHHKAIIISTHILEEVHSVCTRAVIISRGRIVADATPSQLEAMSPHHRAVSLVVDEGRGAELADRLRSLPGVAGVELVPAPDGAVCLTALPAGDWPLLAEIGSLVKQGGWPIRDLRQETGRLEEVFRSLTAGDLPRA